jgi:serine/threonine-protein kinase RsbW
MTNEVSIKLDLPATHQFLNVLGACIARMLESVASELAQEKYNLELAAHELCANIVDHSYAGDVGRIAITLTLQNQDATRRLIIETRDTGARAFDPTRVADPQLDVLQMRGRGVWLITQLMDEVMYRARAGATWCHTPGAGWQKQIAAPANENFWRVSKSF